MVCSFGRLSRTAETLGAARRPRVGITTHLAAGHYPYRWVRRREVAGLAVSIRDVARTFAGMPLLERAEALAGLDGALAAARRGRGRVALVSGGAGMGKTSVVRAFLAGLDAGVAVRRAPVTTC